MESKIEENDSSPIGYYSLKLKSVWVVRIPDVDATHSETSWAKKLLQFKHGSKIHTHQSTQLAGGSHETRPWLHQLWASRIPPALGPCHWDLACGAIAESNDVGVMVGDDMMVGDGWGMQPPPRVWKGLAPFWKHFSFQSLDCFPRNWKCRFF